MSKDYFLKELEFLLLDIPEEEREEALAYYRGCFEEAGAEHEQEVLESIGSLEKAAAELKSSLNGSMEGGEYTDRGYYDRRFDEKNRVPDLYTGLVRRCVRGQGQRKQKNRSEERKAEHTQKESENRHNGLLFLLLFIFFGLPAAGTLLSAGFSVIAGVAGAIFGVFAGLLGLVAGGAAAAVALVILGISLIVTGVANLSLTPVALMSICFGFFALAGAMLAVILLKWGCTTAVPGLLGFGTSFIRGCCGWILGLVRSMTRRLPGRGGEGR
ncbi:HAAS signaling domain-containing protein [Parablautia sp. Marseille-Q6255]|uniref:HAAS signaling domain-containing protein n=1 Tax=Parablautia sp. Marseille-Q6255 TaxID=3039593 RepID=UPI0024BD2834|nr:hypothetical protein [Parablautia sp. Marseille-Q6255]